MTTNYEDNDIEIKDVLPLLPIRDLVVYPFMILPLFVGREASMKAVEHALVQSDRLILLASQKDVAAESPNPSEIFELGTVAMIMRMRKLPDGRIKILIQGLCKARILSFEQLDPYFISKVEKVDDIRPDENPVVESALIRTIKEQLEKIIAQGKAISPDILMVIEDITDPSRLADLIASNLNLKVEESQAILECLNPIERLYKINEILSREIEILNTQASFSNINTNPRDQLIKEQLEALKKRVEENQAEENEFVELREKLLALSMPQDTEKEVLKQLTRLEKMHPDSSEAAILRNYIDWIIDLPWNVTTEDRIDLDEAKNILDEDHFDLHKVKERILEYLAVKQLKGKDMKGPILCFSGPPGVGKTSLGKSIARSLGRKFVRISFGGVKDEGEVRGHRRTYVGSMPGRIIQAYKQAGSNNPVILLDEVDKLGSDIKGDPASALLEVLDPEQNHSFRDHYLNVPFDLSNTMFIATANVLEQIPAPLRDRMEVIALSGYSQEEKIEISKKYLIPKQMDENGIGPDHIEFTDEGVSSVIRNFTSEAGLRHLERYVGSLCRKVAIKIAKGEVGKTHILPETVEKLLGPALFSRDEEKDYDEVGVTTGLAWTAVGGEILFIEATMMKGKGLTLTGQLGDVMKESAQAAFAHIKAHAKEFGINPDIFDEKEIHIHLPAGAIPKDGPSAGITLATSIVSLLTGLPVNHKVAMTGEITLTGKVLPIGGLKEKSLAAMRSNIDTIIIPFKNQKDLIEIHEEHKKKIKFIPVKNFCEVLKIALIGWEEHIEEKQRATRTNIRRTLVA